QRGDGDSDSAGTVTAVSPQSVTGVFCPAHTDVALVSCGLERGRFLISDVPFPGSTVTVLKRPPFCPAKLGGDTPGDRGGHAGVTAAVAVLLEATCGHVLLTRRATTLRHFPNVWVPPGGHLEPGEELVAAGLRELAEETGLHLEPGTFSWHLLGLWESLFPPSLSWGPPRCHHIVTYLGLRSAEPRQRLQVHLTHQEVLLELQLPEGLQRPRPRRGSQPAVPVTGAAEPGAGAELALLQRQHGLVQEELSRCRQLCQERAQEAAALESRLRDSERERSRLERELQEARGAPAAAPRGRRAAEPRRRSLPAGDALYLSFTPPQLSHASSPAAVPFHAPAFPGSRDELEFRGTDPERLREGEDTLDVLLEDEGGLGGRHSPPASPRGGSLVFGGVDPTLVSRFYFVNPEFFHRFPEDAGYSRGGGEQPGAEGGRRGQLGTPAAPPAPHDSPPGHAGGWIQLWGALGKAGWGRCYSHGSLMGILGGSCRPLPYSSPGGTGVTACPSSSRWDLFIYLDVLGCGRRGGHGHLPFLGQQ
uniref:m7GpppN-mRNA hydrolase NUDT17 n=1 Tax=Junco hyemalis TaxID=40217 RepID=A0A8C5J3V0_JUNHY